MVDICQSLLLHRGGKAGVAERRWWLKDKDYAAYFEAHSAERVLYCGYALTNQKRRTKNCIQKYFLKQNICSLHSFKVIYDIKWYIVVKKLFILNFCGKSVSFDTSL